MKYIRFLQQYFGLICQKKKGMKNKEYKISILHYIRNMIQFSKISYDSKYYNFNNNCVQFYTIYSKNIFQDKMEFYDDK